MAGQEDPTTGKATDGRAWHTLDRDLGRLARVEAAAMHLSRPMLGWGVAMLFVVLAALLAGLVMGHEPGVLIITAAAAVAAYMALNIGANDVANNMGPAVGAKALPMLAAVALAAVCESAGALLAGGNVVDTIANGIIIQVSTTTPGPEVMTWAMMAALLSAALWVNLATWIGAPVSTTQAVVGGVMGAGIAAVGFEAVNWETLGLIAISWVLAPVMGGLVAAGVLAFIRWRVIDREDMVAAARTWVPVLIGIMAWTFGSYLAQLTLSRVMTIGTTGVLVTGVVAGLVCWIGSVRLIRWQAEGLENRMRSVKRLFSLPLVVAAALLSFAHGANDVANAVGPLAAIVHAQQEGTVGALVQAPGWVMPIGALGISVGLLLFGPRLIRMVGTKITKLNPMRGYCVMLSAALTVLLASWAGMPVSATHIAVGGVFGVGFFREWLAARQARRAGERAAAAGMPVEERARRKLVRRSHFMTIVAAWVITVPAAALLSAVVFLILNGLFG